MANIYLENFEDIYTECMNRAKEKVTNTDILAQMKRLINERYEDVSNAKLWWWLQEKSHIDMVAYYNTGTVAVTQDSTTVTGTSTVWTSAMVGRRFFTVAHEEIYRISAVASTTSLTLETEWAGDDETEGAYYIDQDLYSLASDLDRMVHPHHAFWPYNVRAVGLEEMRRIKAYNLKKHDKPRLYTLMGFDSSGYRQILFDTGGDEDPIVLYYDYLKKITTLSATTDKPLIPQKFRHILVEGALADYYRDYLRQQDIANTHEGRYTSLLKRMARDWEVEEDVANLRPDNRFFRRKRLYRKPWWAETGINE